MYQNNRNIKILLTGFVCCSLGLIAVSLAVIAFKPNSSPTAPEITTKNTPNTIPTAPNTTIVSMPNSMQNKVLDTNNLTIGVFGVRNSTNSKSPMQLDFNLLVNYLQSVFGSQVKINLVGDENLSYKDAKTQIINKNWDIAFTSSSFLSVTAQDNKYSFAAKMYPKSKEPYYQAALFVKADSKIQSLADLKSTTTIALGEFNSPHSLHMPAYDLYGLTLQVDMGHKLPEITDLVATGNADIGAGIYSLLKDDSRFRIIHRSKDIPAAGVYLSPNLSISDKTKIKQALLDAPLDVQLKANYVKGEEVDYTSFKAITQRAEEVLACADFTKKQVEFFCSKTATTATPNPSPTLIEGKVNGVSLAKADTIEIKLSGNDNQVYLVYISRLIFNQLPNTPSTPFELRGKTIKIKNVSPTSTNKTLELRINKTDQIEVL